VDIRMLSGFDKIYREHPDKIALYYLGQEFSYKKLKELIDKFGSALYDLGARDNDKVLIYLSNCPQFLIGYFGAQQIGAIPVPVSPIYTSREIEYMINHCGAETILCHDTNLGYVKQVLPTTSLKRVIVTNIADMIPLWKRAVGLMFDKIPRGRTKKADNIYFFTDLMKKSSGKLPEVNIGPEHIAAMLFTGGTTGFPKGAANTHLGMMSAIRGFYDSIEGYVDENKDKLLIINPLYHMMAQGAIMGFGLTRGITTVLMPQPDVDALLETIQRVKVTLFLGVPTLFRMILENDRLDKYDLSSLKYCWSGGDVLPMEVYNRWLKLTGIPIRQNYGCTECSRIITSPLDCVPPPGSLGRPEPAKEIKIVDPETLEPVPVNTQGELLVRFEGMTGEYWNNPEETANSYVQIDGKKWYRTKDYMRYDENGIIYYVERSADIIKYKAYKVSCSEIEAVLLDHPAVIGACVVGVPDPSAGERIKAIVVMKEDARGVGAPDLIRWCRERLSPYKVPKYIEFRDMLPKSKVGKLLRREIRDEERRKSGKK
jgi:long-chain acyl-CoA synthetase